MTGYSARMMSLDCAGQAFDAEFELRAVNGRGLDIRLKIPEFIQFAEKSLRDAIAAHVARGNVSLSLKLRIGQDVQAVALDLAQLNQVLDTLVEVTQMARDKGMNLAPPNALDLVNLRDVQPRGQDFAIFPPQELGAILSRALGTILSDFDQMRRTEGAALARILEGQIDQIAALTADARKLIDTRAEMMQAHFRKILAKTIEATATDPARLEQELALIAVKADIAEELDRLDAHCTAARALMAQDGPVGRKLDFLTQEFNREANTLCSKAQHLELTRIGLDLKAVIDQMREQVQNVE